MEGRGFSPEADGKTQTSCAPRSNIFCQGGHLAEASVVWQPGLRIGCGRGDFL